MQAVEDILNSTGKRLLGQIPGATPPCILGQYHPLSTWNKGHAERKDRDKGAVNGVGGCADSNTYVKENTGNTSGNVNGFKRCPAVWATAVAWKVEGGGFVPRLVYIGVRGVQYHAVTHVSGISFVVLHLSRLVLGYGYSLYLRGSQFFLPWVGPAEDDE